MNLVFSRLVMRIFGRRNVETMRCDWCGKEFPADARACVEGGIDLNMMLGAGDAEELVGVRGDTGEWKGLGLDPDDIPEEHAARIMGELGLDRAQFETLIRTGTVAGLGSIVCLDCQDGVERPEFRNPVRRALSHELAPAVIGVTFVLLVAALAAAILID